jgi:ribosome biogenesis protein YTM1
MLRGFDYSQKPVASSVLHTGPASSIAVIGSSSGEDSYTILTGSHDLSAKISRILLSATEQATVTELASLHLHTGPISSVAASVSGQTLLTASWDNLIGIWDAKIPEHDEVPLPPDGSERKKRRKVAIDRMAKRKAPVGVLKLHTARVSKVVFGSGPNEQGNAYSCGLDSTIRIWDVENGLCTRTIVSSSFMYVTYR